MALSCPGLLQVVSEPLPAQKSPERLVTAPEVLRRWDYAQIPLFFKESRCSALAGEEPLGQQKA